MVMAASIDFVEVATECYQGIAAMCAGVKLHNRYRSFHGNGFRLTHGLLGTSNRILCEANRIF